MPPVILRFSQRFVRILQTFSRDDQREARRLISVIVADPEIDNQIKLPLPRPPFLYTAYVTRRVWIVYRVVGDEIQLVNLRHSSLSAPSPD